MGGGSLRRRWEERGGILRRRGEGGSSLAVVETHGAGGKRWLFNITHISFDIIPLPEYMFMIADQCRSHNDKSYPDTNQVVRRGSQSVERSSPQPNVSHRRLSVSKSWSKVTRKYRYNFLEEGIRIRKWPLQICQYVICFPCCYLVAVNHIQYIDPF